MAGYTTLGYRPVKAAADTTGWNPGNYTATLDGQLITSTVPTFELYHMYLTAPSLPAAETIATVMLNQGHWDVTLIGQANSWDPSQPMLLTPGDTIYVMFNVPTTNTAIPTVTCWFRYQS